MDGTYDAWGGSSYSPSPLSSVTSSTPFSYEDLLQRLASDLQNHTQSVVSELLARSSYVTRADFDASLRRVARLEDQIRIASEENDQRQDETTALRREITSLKTQITDLRNRPDRSPSRSHLKPALPQTYDGTSKDLADEFLFQVENYSRILPFENDAVQILWAQGYLSGAPRKWSALVTASTSSDLARDSWPAWRAAFEARYCDRDRSGTAIRRLEDLEQGDRHITEYVTEFEDLRKELNDADRNGELVYRHFWNGLSIHDKERLANHGYQTVDEAEAWLLSGERLWQDIEREKEKSRGKKKNGFERSSHISSSSSTSTLPPTRAPFSPRPSPPSTTPTAPTVTSAPPPPPRDPNAMDVDKARRDNRCRRCQGYGHQEKDCPSPMPFSRRGRAVNRDVGTTENGQETHHTGLSGFVEG